MPGSSRTSLERSEPFSTSRRRDSSGVPRMTYVEPRSWAVRNGFDQVLAVDLEEVDAEDRSEPPERRELCLLLLGELMTSRAYPDGIHVAAQALRRAPRSPHDPLRFGCGSTSASTRSVTACLLSGSRAVVHAETERPPRPLSRDFAKRGEVLVPEEVLERDLGPLAR